jgi:hypothetical protein
MYECAALTCISPQAAHPFAFLLLAQRAIPRSSLPHISIHYLAQKRGQLLDDP